MKYIVREGFASDEELSLYDMLFREDLSKNDIRKLKEVTAALHQKIKAKISELDHWTDKQETKAVVDNLIRDTLWAKQQKGCRRTAVLPDMARRFSFFASYEGEPAVLRQLFSALRICGIKRLGQQAFQWEPGFF